MALTEVFRDLLYDAAHLMRQVLQRKNFTALYRIAHPFVEGSESRLSRDQIPCHIHEQIQHVARSYDVPDWSQPALDFGQKLYI